MALSQSSLAGPGYIILQIIRVMNIIGLLAVITGSIVMLVKTSVASKFFFFDAVSHVLTAITGSTYTPGTLTTRPLLTHPLVFLTISELQFGFIKRYFARNWPLLSSAHGFVTLALAMMVLGINMLGNLNKPATSKKSLGMAFWRIVIASGIIIFILGWINLLASYIFRDRSAGVTARMVHSHGAVAAQQSPKSTGSHTPTAPELAQTYIHHETVTPTKTSNPFRIVTGRRNSILPSYHATTPPTNSAPYPTIGEREPVSPTSRYSRATQCTKKKVFGMFGRNSTVPPLPTAEPEISGPLNRNGQFDGYGSPVRPPSALHPSRSGESEAYRWRAGS